MSDTSKPPPALPDYAIARRAYARGDYLTAARIVSAHLKAGASGPEVRTDLALAMEKLGKYDIAERLLREAIALGGYHARTPRALARVLGETGRPAEALDLVDQMLAQGADETFLAHPRYDLVADLGDTALAERIADAAVRAGSPDPGARFDRGRFRLKRGDYLGGFADYEARWDVRPWTRRHAGVPAWTGDRLGRRTLLVHDEQGFGDTIQFMRFLPEAKRRFGGRIVFEVREELMPFARSVKGIDRLVARDADPGQVDVQTPIMSLAHHLGVTLETLPNACPYIEVDPTPFDLPGKNGRFAIGLNWAGKPTNQNDHNRSMRFADLAPLVETPGVAFYALQNGAAAAQRDEHPLGARVVDLAPMTRPFEDAARAMRALDLIVTVDTGYAHLAGALGRATIVMLGHRTDWRWLDKRTDCPWYPATTLVRQTRTNHWTDVVTRVRDLVRSLASSPRAAA